MVPQRGLEMLRGLDKPLNLMFIGKKASPGLGCVYDGGGLGSQVGFFPQDHLPTWLLRTAKLCPISLTRPLEMFWRICAVRSASSEGTIPKPNKS